MSYQKARYIRSHSLSDLLAGELASGAGFGKSIKKVIGLRTKAKITGIKEKFDPLNIIKVLTGGSNLAPALLGRLFGRSQRDIENFAGKSRLVGNKVTKVGKLPSEEGSGLMEILHKIYSFMKKSQEHDILIREKTNNFREEQQLEDERRHKQLLKALTELVEGKKENKDKATKQSGSNWWDNIKSALLASWKAISKAFSWVGKFIGKIISKVKSLAIRLWNKIKNVGVMLWEKISAAISSILTPIIENLRKWFPKSMEMVEKGIEKLKGVGEKLFPKAAVKTEAKVAEGVAEKALTKTFWKGIPIIGLGAGLFFGAQRAIAGDWIGAGLEVAGGAVGATGIGLPAELAIAAGTAAWEAKYDSDNGLDEEQEPNEDEEPTATLLSPTDAGAGRGTAEFAATDPRRTDRAENISQVNNSVTVEQAQKARSDFAAIDPRRTDRAEPVATPPPSSVVTPASVENQMLQLQSQTSSSSSSTTTNNVVNSSASKPQNNTLGMEIPAVRNTEDTFRRLSMDSTRLV